MRPFGKMILGTMIVMGIPLLAGCGGKKAADDTTNIIEMNASDGTMNDMTVVESATLDQAGASLDADNAAANGTAANNSSNAN